MAAKADTMKLLQEIRGYAEITNRRPKRQLPGLFFAQMRAQMLRVLPRPRRQIPVATQEFPEAAVKITFLARAPLPALVGPASPKVKPGMSVLPRNGAVPRDSSPGKPTRFFHPALTP
jgi:hypothetical protein